MDAQTELDRLAGKLARAVPGSVVGYAKLRPLDAGRSPDEVYAKVIVDTLCPDDSMDDARVITTSHATREEAVAELRAILRADTDGAVADAVAPLAAAMREYIAARDMVDAIDQQNGEIEEGEVNARHDRYSAAHAALLVLIGEQNGAA